MSNGGLSAGNKNICKMNTSSEKVREEDDLDVFLSGIARTVRKFPRLEIARVKQIINNAVSEMEIAIASNVRLVYTLDAQGELTQLPNGEQYQINSYEQDSIQASII